MPSARFDSRAAATTLIVLSLAAPAAVGPSRVALGQSLSPFSLDLAPLRDLPAVPPIPGADARRGAALAPAQRRGAQEAPPSGAPNYGLPRPRVVLPKPYPPPQALKPPPFSPTHPLPRLKPYRTSAEAKEASRRRYRVLRLGLRGALELPERPPPSTVAVPDFLPPRAKPLLEPDPYGPLGFGIGSLRLYAYAEPSYGYDTNPNRLAQDVQGSRFARVDVGLRLRSEWTRDDVQANLRLGYVDYFSVENADRPDGVGDFLYRYDVARDTKVKFEGRFTLDTQRPGAPGLATNSANVVVINRPLIVSLGTAVGVTQSFGRLDATLRGSFDRWIYQNAYYNDGSVLDLAATSYNAYGVNPRIAYELTPSVRPYAEAILDRRVHDSWLDPYGYARDSTGAQARVGTTFKITDLLRGEASGGYAQRDYADVRLPLLRGPIIDAALIYSATPLTTFTLRTGTTLSETSLAGAAGILSRNVTLDVVHAFRRNFIVTGTGSFQTNNYQGGDRLERVVTAGVKLEYKITRSIAIKASYFYQHLASSAGATSSFTANVIMAGVRFEP
ncbi:outer membrane beta-barrel protein [Methylosinus trichosporium]|uniref:outer membrane beta-barrel protein n=1 Tax=Methylosinus trichosporium TaxID=426 RepID=UPI0001D2D2F0|nr:outer membrane beta-barrel protein [Methylosinus trichosporium]